MRKSVWLGIAAAVSLVAFAFPAAAQQSPDEKQESSPQVSAPRPPDGPPPADQTKPDGLPTHTSSKAPFEHRFWDRENDWLFAGVGAGRALDYASTLNLRRRGINEVFLNNAIVDNHPLFAGIEVAGTAASIGVSYLFHRANHHRLERWTSIIHFGVSTGGAIRNYSLKTPH